MYLIPVLHAGDPAEKRHLRVARASMKRKSTNLSRSWQDRRRGQGNEKNAREVKMFFESMKVPERKCSCGVEQRVAVLLSYVLGWVGGLIFFFMEKDNKFVRFSAMQSLILSAGWFAVWLTLAIFGGVLSVVSVGLGYVFTSLEVLVFLAMAGLVVLLTVQGWKGTKIKLLVIGALAEKWSKSSEV
jgi:uncharacterized membrane protein